MVVPDALIALIQGIGVLDDARDELIHLVRERDAFGRAKYGQPLMSNDGRNGIEDARQELGDLLQYVMKCKLAGQDISDLLSLIEDARWVMYKIDEL